MAIYVLVHGAFQGAWVYARLARALRVAGHEVHAPTLTGLGERSHLANWRINLDTHVRDVVNTLVYEDLDDVVLCGHSYGGMVITGVANEVPERVRSLVYIDAYVPAEGESLTDIQGTEAAVAWVGMARSDGGLIPPIHSSAFNVNIADAPRIDALSGAQSLATFVQGVKGGIESDVLKDKSRTFVFASANGGDWFLSTHERLRNHPDWQVYEVPCGHNIMLDRPSELAGILLRVAEGESAAA